MSRRAPVIQGFCFVFLSASEGSATAPRHKLNTGAKGIFVEAFDAR